MKRDYVCKKCGCGTTFMEQSGCHIGLYCSDCGKWITWLNKDEVRRINHENMELKEQKNDKTESNT